MVACKRADSSVARLGKNADKISWFNLDTDDVALPFQRCGHIDVVIHASTCYGRKGEPISAIFEANVGFPLRLLDAAARFGVSTFFNTDTVLDPRLNPYALTKRHFSEWGRMTAEPGGFRFANIRLEHIYGAGDDPSKFTTHIIKQCLQNVPEIPLTAGEQMRDFVYIDDAVDAYLLLLERQAELPRGFVDLGLGSGCAVSIKAFVELAHVLCHSTSRLDFGVLSYRRHEIMNSNADISLLGSLGWHPRFSLADGLHRMIEEERSAIILHEGIKQ